MTLKKIKLKHTGRVVNREKRVQIVTCVVYLLGIIYKPLTLYTHLLIVSLKHFTFMMTSMLFDETFASKFGER